MNTLKYIEPLYIVLRKGDVGDPYQPMNESRKIINSMVVLSEIPDRTSHVVVSGYTEIYTGNPTSLQFIVNYNNGIVNFNSTEEGKTLSFVYQGRGIIQYPADRVLAHRAGQPDVVENIQEMIDRGQDALVSLDTLDAKIVETNNAITNANSAANDLIHRGTWNNVTAYKKRNVVYYSGASYMSILDNTNQTPTNTTYWQFMSQKGDQGPQGQQGPVGYGLTWKGIYNGSTQYVVRDIVSYNGNSYICKTDASAGIIPTNGTYWDLIAQKGDQGIQGIQGIQGVQGIQGPVGPLGPRGVNWLGAYNSATQYATGDSVSLNGSAYVCKSVPPVGTSPTNTTYWDILAAKGDNGTGTGTVTNVSSANGDIIVGTPDTTPVLTLNAGIGANKIVRRDGAGKIVDLASYATLAGATFTGAVIVDVGGGGLKVKPSTSDHAYMELYARTATPNTRSGYVGYGGAASTTLALTNEVVNGNVNLITNGTGIVQANGNAVWHAGNFTPANKLDTAGGTLTGAITLNNNIALKGKKSDGTPVFIAFINATDNVIIGDASRPIQLYSSVDPQFYNGSTTKTLWHNGNFDPTTKMDKSGGIFTGAVTIDVGDGLKLKSSTFDYTYMSFYARTATPNTRSGWIGYGTAATNDLTIKNEIADAIIALTTSGANGSVVVTASYLSVNGMRNFGKLAVAPSNPISGDEYYNTTDNRKYIYNGTIWIDVLKYQ